MILEFGFIHSDITGTGRDDGMIGHVAHRLRRLTQQRVIIVVTFRHVTRKI